MDRWDGGVDGAWRGPGLPISPLGHRVRVLLVENSPSDARPVEAVLAGEGSGLHVRHARGLGEAIRLLAHQSVDVVLLDLTLPDAAGLEGVVAVRRVCPDVPIVVLSHPGDEQTALAAIQSGAQDYLFKSGIDSHLLWRSLRYAIERKRTELALNHQALHDPLTGLANRALFLDRLQQAIHRLERRPGCVAVLFMDLDRFKRVNDSLGHEAGDELLAEVARRLRRILRPTDSAGRVGDDEFLVLCEGLDYEAEALVVARRIQDAFDIPFELRQGRIRATTSIGIATSASAAATPQDLVRDADAALYQAKERGKARSELFDSDMRGQAQARLELEDALHLAIERRQFELHYQPIVQLSTGRVMAVEALLRWRRPGRGLVAPDEFIPVAEETGMIVPLGALALEAAVAQAASWRGGSGPPTSMSVNLSARQLLDPAFVGLVEKTLGRAGLDGRSLCFEVTESVVMRDEARSLRVLQELKALGAELWIDDFGTGYSSLGYLQRFPFDAVKIDQSFIRGVSARPGDRAIVRAVVDVGRALGLAVVAEGIETPVERAEVEALGCDLGQGYLFARPGNPETVRPLLSRQFAGEGR